MNLHTANIKFLQTNNDFVASEGGKTKQVITDETIITTVSHDDLFEGEFAYSTFIDADEIIVTFDGTEYTCQKFVGESGFAYGGFGSDGPDFSQYPFFIITDATGNRLYTQTAGTYTVKIEIMV